MDGFGPQVFAWFEGIERDNSKEYFHATRDFYEEHVREAPGGPAAASSAAT